MTAKMQSMNGTRAAAAAGLLFCLAVLLATAVAAQATGDSWASPAPPGMNGQFQPLVARTQMCCIWAGTRMLVFGGYDGTACTNKGASYNPSTDTWESKPNLTQGFGAPAPRREACAVWTGSYMIIWGGAQVSAVTTVAPIGGGVYNPATDVWETRARLNAGTGEPTPRILAEAVWTGTYMVVFGGRGTPISTFLPNGGRYNFATDTWTSSPGLNGLVGYVPTQCAVWTGSRMLLFGGLDPTNGLVNMGKSYNPATDAWDALPNFKTGVNAPAARQYANAVWTGTKYLVWGGYGASTSSPFSDGGLYNPLTDAWESRPMLNSLTAPFAPAARTGATVLWTGTRMLVWGGSQVGAIPTPPVAAVFLDTGASYDPVSDNWERAPALNNGTSAPLKRMYHAGTWSGDKLIVWDGTTDPALNSNSAFIRGGSMYRPPNAYPVIDSVAPAAAVADAPFSYAVTTVGIPATVIASGLPAWASMTGGVITGTPTRSYTGSASNVLLTATNGNPPDATQSFTLTVNASPMFMNSPPTGISAGDTFSYTPVVNASPTATVFKSAGPSWLVWDGVKISGVPVQSAIGTSVSFELSASNTGFNTVTQTWQFTVSYAPMDVDHSGAVSVADVQAVVNLILRTAQPAYAGQGDVNADTRVNSVDLQQVVNKVLHP